MGLVHSSEDALIPTVQTADASAKLKGWEEHAATLVTALMPRLDQAILKASERLYEEVLDTAEDYLKDNAIHIIGAAIAAADRQALHDRQALIACDQHREELFWALKALIATARAEDAKGGLGARLMAAVDRAEKTLDAKPQEASR